MTPTPTQAPRFVVTATLGIINIYLPALGTSKESGSILNPIMAGSMADALEFMSHHAQPGETARIVKHDGTIETVQFPIAQNNTEAH